MSIFSRPLANQAPTADTRDPQQRIKEYLEMRRKQVEALVPSLDILQTGYYRRAGITIPADLARKQIQLIDSVLGNINSGSPKETIIYNLKDIFSRVELQAFYIDIESLLATGKTVLPLELADFPAYFEKKAAEQEAQKVRAHQQEKARMKAAASARMDAGKQAARQKLAQELGISEEAIFAKNRD